jgi:hypothetical protein
MFPFSKRQLTNEFLWTTASEYSSLYSEHGSVVVKALCYKPEGRRFET